MGELTPAQFDYVLFHLKHHACLPDDLIRGFMRQSASHSINVSNRVIFFSSATEFVQKEVVEISGLPVLFPCSQRKEFFFFDDSGNLVFCHDLLKAIFYLLSGYQEYENRTSRDALNRFSYTDSIQHKLGFVAKPLVNYYMEVLIDGLRQFCLKNNVSLERRKLFHTFGFLLTHDIDVVDYYTYNFLGYKFKEIVGIKKSKLPVYSNVKLFVHGLLKYLRLSKKDNPYWNFEYLRRLERNRAFRSVFFFLDKGIKNHDAPYSFDEKRMIELFSFLQVENCEIGLHGTVKSVHNSDVMKSSLEKLQKASEVGVTGIRQHRLLWEHPRTAEIQESIGLKYDSTLGFAAHEGFRNSYCWPYRLFSFEQDRMLDVWEYPLNVMDVTLFAYQQYTPETAMEKCIALIDEIQKFGGVFTVLWHNSFFDEDVYPGVTNFYSSLLNEIALRVPENVTGNELTMRIENHVR
ncbi:MAG: polysaccharide deacetylase family protein [Cyclobacteriaceae bacterium]